MGEWSELRGRVAVLQGQDAVDPDDLDLVWSQCRTVRPEEILGSWRGSDFATGHPVSGLLVGSRWHGKRFDSVEEAHPLICRDETGELFSNAELGKGLASLWSVEFRGETTATMVYDGQPVFDHFKAVDDDTLLGIMNGKGVLVGGRHYYFLLERER